MRPFLFPSLLAVLLISALGCDGGQESSNSGGEGGEGAGGGSGGTGTTGTPTAGSGGTSTTSDTPTPMECAGEPDHTGKVTYYNEADGSGACSFDPTPNDLMVGAMNAPEYDGSAACGACVAIDGPGGESITVRIVDLCPGCDTGHIDLSPDAFSKLGELSAGVLPVTWRYVSCNYPGPVQYKFKEGSNQWWSAVQVRNHSHRIAKFEWDKDGTWIAVERTSYNYFVEPDGMGPGPYHFRITDVTGQVLEDEGIEFEEGGVKSGKSQFAPCSMP
ncbi:MAG: expansin EXLX1 family cellulose-binding protein [Polyangiaceae bacterium]